MRRILKDDNTLNELLSERDKVLYNLFYMIKEKGYIETNDKNFILGQSDKICQFGFGLMKNLINQ